MPNVAEIVVAALYAKGVRTVFGLPGGETIEIIEALRQRGIEFVLVHSEASAVFMADALARLTGVPGVCLTTLGPAPPTPSSASRTPIWIDLRCSLSPPKSRMPCCPIIHTKYSICMLSLPR